MPSWMKKTGCCCRRRVEVPLFGVELGREAARVHAPRVGTPTTVEKRTNRSLRGWILELRAGHVHHMLCR
jgi:hypothetical protein